MKPQHSTAVEISGFGCLILKSFNFEDVEPLDVRTVMEGAMQDDPLQRPNACELLQMVERLQTEAASESTSAESSE